MISQLTSLLAEYDFQTWLQNILTIIRFTINSKQIVNLKNVLFESSSVYSLYKSTMAE